MIDLMNHGAELFLAACHMIRNKNHLMDAAGQHIEIVFQPDSGITLNPVIQKACRPENPLLIGEHIHRDFF